MLAPPFYIMFHNAIILALSPALFSLFLSIFNIQFFSLVQKDVDNDFFRESVWYYLYNNYSFYAYWDWLFLGGIKS
ncbi:hypothetical protein HMPREF1231_1714 [Streptococcus pyogenes GA06023]|nr:hypothetical protein HMPREF1231_1714 [Streptococcus pyogenes GA06023]